MWSSSFPSVSPYHCSRRDGLCAEQEPSAEAGKGHGSDRETNQEFQRAVSDPADDRNSTLATASGEIGKKHFRL
uniref:Uncharacterized protein n=1 Tax=Mycena chlorophos TaxID=658473 RepID=A0ABQ0M683_MYCCL|nr:predicted protein [Mycena chlorophos]